MRQQFNDYDIDDAIKNRERNFKLFQKIVGIDPMEQIDWIVENGLDKFNYWFRCYETGLIYSPATVNQKPVERIIEWDAYEVRGGQGNSKLLCWDYPIGHDGVRAFHNAMREAEEDIKW
jgi:hypothetical protein